jgi:drug/metabolite transporter (DMT)-like permease
MSLEATAGADGGCRGLETASEAHAEGTAPAVPQRRIDVVAAGAAGVTLVLWASAFVGIRSAGHHLSPTALALGRLVVGAVVLGAFVLVRREPLPKTRDLPLIAACGVLWLGAYMVALNAAERRVDAGTAAMLVNIGPILIALLAGFLLGEGFPRNLFVGCAIALAGVAAIGLATSRHGAGAWGVALCLAAALGYSGGVVAQKVVLRRVSPLQTIFLACVIAAAALSPAAPSLVHQLGDAPAASIGWLVYLGAFPTALAFTTWAYALARTSAGRLAATTYLVPAISILLGWALLGETPPGLALVGGAICLAGVVVARRQPRTSSSAGSPSR